MYKLFLSLILVSVFGLHSCNFPVPHKLIKELNCYSENDAGVDTLINIHGFYTKMIIRDHEGLQGMKDGKFQKLGVDTSYLNFVFFSDGIFISDIGAAGVSVSEYLNQMAIKGESFNGRSFYQGTYSIRGDTIKVQYISPGYSNVWNGYEVWYKIIDRNTIVDIYLKHLGLSLSDRNKLAYKPKMYNNSNPSKFVFVNNMPKSSSWLKKERWFYCD